MADTTQALETMVRNIEARTGKTMKELGAIVAGSGLTRHGEIRAMLMERFGLTYGHANLVTHQALRSDGESAAAARQLSGDDVLAELYDGKKAGLRPVHDAVLAVLSRLGDYEAAPKKGYVSYRRKKQFVMVGPKTSSQVEIGFGAKDLPGHPRLKVMPPNAMCRYTTRLSSPGQVDALVAGWIEAAYRQSG